MKQKNLVPVLAAVAAVLVAVAVLLWSGILSPGDGANRKKAAPDFTVYTAEGVPVKLSDFKGKPVVLNFWATWCGPCKMIAPLLTQIAEEREDVVIGKVDVDSEMELAMQFGVASIPTLVVIKDGKPAGKAVGYMPKEKILALLDA